MCCGFLGFFSFAGIPCFKQIGYMSQCKALSHPRETANLESPSILNYLAVVSYATQSFAQDTAFHYPLSSPSKSTPSPTSKPRNNENHKGSEEDSDYPNRQAWLTTLSQVISSVKPTSHAVTSILTLLAGSVSHGTPLPPYMEAPAPYNLSQRLEAEKPDILDARHVLEPGYAAFAALQIAATLMMDDIEKLMDSVRELVGETDFGFVVKGEKEWISEMDEDDYDDDGDNEGTSKRKKGVKGKKE
jgi:hypothetical protein